MNRIKNTIVLVSILSCCNFFSFYATALNNEKSKSKIVEISAEKFKLMRKHYLENVVLGSNTISADQNVKNSINYTVKKAKVYWESMSKNPFETGFLWSDYSKLTNDAMWSARHITSCVERLEAMAKAYAYVGTDLYHDKKLLTDLNTAISFIYRRAYNENTKHIGNWWNWNIGTPLSLAKSIAILYDDIPSEIKEGYYRTVSSHITKVLGSNQPNDTYGNRAWHCQVLFFFGVLSGNETDINYAINALDKALIDNTTIAERKKGQEAFEVQWKTQQNGPNFNDISFKDGLYEDGSFIQHLALPYIGEYGAIIIQSVANFSSVLNGTGIGLSDEVKASLVKWIDGPYLLSLYEGEIMQMFCGRRVIGNPHDKARLILIDIAKSANLLDPADKKRILPVVKRMLVNDTYWNDIYANLDLTMIPTLKSLLEDNSIKISENANFTKIFSACDRVIHNQDHWCFGISMSSSRIGKHESLNGDNPTGWYLGDGMTFIYNGDRDHWVDYFKKVDPHRLPGTTVDTIKRELTSVIGTATDRGNYGFFGLPRNTKDWTGGASLNESYGIAGMYLMSEVSTLEAKKSWFMFDNEIVALGAGISMTEKRAPITIIENRAPLGKLKQIPTLTIDGKTKATQKGWFESLSPSWALLEGTGAYYFPDKKSINFQIDKNGFTQMYINHGVSPTNATYAYVLLPNVSEQNAIDYSTDPEIEILSNTSEIQAVKETNLNILGVNFWVPGRIGIVESKNPASIILRTVSTTLDLSISDPTWKQSSLVIYLEGRYKIVDSTNVGIMASLIDSKTCLVINVIDKMGVAQKVKLIAIK
jgi:hyaluronate lyase